MIFCLLGYIFPTGARLPVACPQIGQTGLGRVTCLKTGTRFKRAPEVFSIPLTTEYTHSASPLCKTEMLNRNRRSIMGKAQIWGTAHPKIVKNGTGPTLVFGVCSGGGLEGFQHMRYDPPDYQFVVFGYFQGLIAVVFGHQPYTVFSYFQSLYGKFPIYKAYGNFAVFGF